MAILNETLAEKRKRADADDLKKNQFEKSMITKLNSFFLVVSRDFEDIYSSTGQVQNFNIYTDDMTALLKTSYRQSSRWFQDNLKRELVKNAEEQEGTDNEELANTLVEERNAIDINLKNLILSAILIRTGQQATEILGTTEKVIAKNVLNTLVDAAEEGEILTNEQVARRATPKIRQENLNRSSGIAQTEIQWSSEGSKQAEGEMFEDQLLREGVVDREGQTPFLEKTWITMGDNVVRESHRLANGQKRRIKEPYLVQGQLLMRPGDTSLGATLDNVIRCRCVSVIG